MKKQLVFLFGATLILQYLMASILCFSISIFFHTYGNLDVPGLIASVFAFIAIIYVFTWNKGQKDAVKVHFNVYKKNNLFGLEAGLFASIPSIIIMGFFYMTLDGSKGIDIALQLISRIWFGAFVRLFFWFDKTQYIYTLPVLLLVLPLVTAVGYYCGLNDISLRRRAVYQEDVKIEYPDKDSSAKGILNEKNMKNLKK